jgi:predicted nucleotidyltransferase component of viral defense system
MNNWLSLKKERQIDLFNQIGAETGLPPFAIEKDAWVTLALRIMFSSNIGDHIVFKGGTSLSKVFHLIERFSEDVDLAINKEYLGFEGNLDKGQIRKLLRASHDFTLNELPEILKIELENYGISEDLFDIIVPNAKISDQDPEQIHLNYQSVFEKDQYLPNRVLIEVGARSLNKPFGISEIRSLIDENFPDSSFSEKKFLIKAILPEKTFLEKMILLHEEFSRPAEKIRHNRMSRHMYDVFKIIETEVGRMALKNDSLFRNICQHRSLFTPIKGIDYDSLKLKDIQLVPPEEVLVLFRNDYNQMRENMIYGDSPGFDELIEKLLNTHKTHQQKDKD